MTEYNHIIDFTNPKLADEIMSYLNYWIVKNSALTWDNDIIDDCSVCMISEGQTLFLAEMEDNKAIEIKSPHNGICAFRSIMGSTEVKLKEYVSIRFYKDLLEFIEYESLERNKIERGIFSDELNKTEIISEIANRYFPGIKHEILVDEFDNSKVVEWRWNDNSEFEGCPIGGKGIFGLEADKLGVMLNLSLRCDMEAGESLTIMYHDEEQQTFYVKEGLGDSKNGRYSFPINQETLDKLSIKLIKAWKFRFADRKMPCVVNSSGVSLLDSAIFREWILRNIKLYKECGLKAYDECGSESTNDKKCYVYLMLDESNGYYKIGISNNPEYRERTLQSEKPTIELIKAKEFPIRKIAEAFESALHKTYESKRLRGEWFKLSVIDVKNIKITLS